MLRKLISVSELSSQTGLSRYMIRKLARENVLPAVPVMPSRLRFDPVTVERVLADVQAGHSSEPEPRGRLRYSSRGGRS